MEASDAIQALSKENLQIALYIAVGILGITSSIIARHFYHYIGAMGERLRKLENWLAINLGYDRDK